MADPRELSAYPEGLRGELETLIERLDRIISTLDSIRGAIRGGEYQRSDAVNDIERLEDLDGENVHLTLERIATNPNEYW